MNTLLMEMLACLFVAALFSLFIGWAMRSAIAARQMKTASAAWDAKRSELELRYKQDTEHLEDQLIQLETESKQLSNRNDSISESLRENEISVHKARADAIELNRQQADTQERLQRIIAQKDEELKSYRQESKQPGVAAAGIAAVGVAGMNAEDAEAKIATLSAKREAWEAERQRLMDSMADEQATMVIDPADLPAEPFDQTVRIEPGQTADLKNKESQQNNLSQRPRTSSEMESDKTLTIDDDQTMLLDDNNMNTNRPKKPSGGNTTPGGTPNNDS